MIFNTQLLALTTVASTLVSALPLDNIAPRAKSYSVVNVGGGTSTQAPAGATTVVDQTTKTVEVTNAGPTVTAKVTTTVIELGPVPAEISTMTPTPILVTVTVTDDAGPTEYYDDGMWHTHYRIKTFEAVAAPTLLSTLSDMAASSTGVPAW
ncbi:hypothetical protein N0V91_000745 [Didymella pomorum]|uniref:Uncharacterized protein n=1 Tax=Didymella pomorum TaxID=749634 RepID=A0A9W8ZPW8_9PLEO|nr:hypothetical protein N0V91_000745 [Didymella pomorum]